MMDDDSLPWGTLQCAGKLAGHRSLDWRWKDPRNFPKETVLLQSYLQHISSNPEALNHPCAWQPWLALSPTKCNVPSVERQPRYPGKLPKLQLQQLHPLVEFGCSQVHLFGSPVKSHHPPFSSWERPKRACKIIKWYSANYSNLEYYAFDANYSNLENYARGLPINKMIRRTHREIKRARDGSNKQETL